MYWFIPGLSSSIFFYYQDFEQLSIFLISGRIEKLSFSLSVLVSSSASLYQVYDLSNVYVFCQGNIKDKANYFINKKNCDNFMTSLIVCLHICF